MEIIDYLRIARRRWWILVAVPVLAAVTALVLILMQPATYSATATVSTSTLVGGEGSPFAGTQGVQQFVAAFTAAGQNPRTRAAVEAATNVAPGAQADAVLLDPVGASADMRVEVTLPKREQAGPVATETAKQALSQLFDERAKEAVASRDVAQKAAADANAAITELARKYQIANPPQAYQAQLNQVASLQQQQANLRAQGNAIGAAAMDDPINKAKAELAAFLPILGEYYDLQARQTAVNNDLSQAQAQYRQAASLATAATADTVVYVGGTTQTDRSATMVTTVPVVFGAGIFLAVVLILLIEVAGRLRPPPIRTAGRWRRPTAVSHDLADGLSSQSSDESRNSSSDGLDEVQSGSAGSAGGDVTPGPSTTCESTPGEATTGERGVAMGREESVQPVAKADADNRVRVTDDASHEPVGAHT